MAKEKAPIERTHADKVADREAGKETSANAKTHGAPLQGKPVATTEFKTGRQSDKPGVAIEHPDGDFVAE